MLAFSVQTNLAKQANWRRRQEQRPLRVCCVHRSPSETRSKLSRRAGLVGLGVALVGYTTALPATAGRPPVPKEYNEFVDELATELIGAIELEKSGAEEREVRRKADKAKNLVKKFILSWRGDIRVSKTDSYKEVATALRELFDFYTKEGQRARLPGDLSEDIVVHLKAAQSALAPT